MNRDVEIEIRTVVQALQDNQNDVEAFLALHDQDAVIVNFGGRRVVGRDALAQAMSEALGSPLADVRTTNDVIDVRLVRPDVAVVSCVKHVRDERADGEPLATRGSLTYVLVDHGGAWQVALAQTTPIAAT
ncbi:MAG: DUF4440 domain-containing protein [Acidimicrobiaceae bacterium]|nr:DUF4440 domain-containing protein [Acidimicrobiaceae bacterium]